MANGDGIYDIVNVKGTRIFHGGNCTRDIEIVVAFKGAGGIDPYKYYEILTTKIFLSRDTRGAKAYIRDTIAKSKLLKSKKGVDVVNTVTVTLVGYSWGAWSCLEVAEWIGLTYPAGTPSLIVSATTYTLDPVQTGRNSPQNYTSTFDSAENVAPALNIFQRNGLGRHGVDEWLGFASDWYVGELIPRADPPLAFFDAGSGLTLLTQDASQLRDPRTNQKYTHISLQKLVSSASPVPRVIP